MAAERPFHQNKNTEDDDRYIVSRPFTQDIILEDRVLGRGLCGAVKSAGCRNTGAKFAVKRLCKRTLPAEAFAHAHEEAMLHLSLDHPHLVGIERVYETSDEVDFVMELLDGGEVFDALADGTYSEAEAAGALRQMLSAVSYLHSKHVVHRDIKLENFVYGTGGRAAGLLKLIDFGCACRFDPQEKMTQYCGTLDYNAPELLGRSYTEKVDVWALGVVAYLLLCGATPWSGSDTETARMIRAGRPHRPKHLFDPLSAPAKDFVELLMAFDPSRRMSAAEALQHPWLAASGTSVLLERSLKVADHNAGLGCSKAHCAEDATGFPYQEFEIQIEFQLPGKPIGSPGPESVTTCSNSTSPASVTRSASLTSTESETRSSSAQCQAIAAQKVAQSQKQKRSARAGAVSCATCFSMFR